MDNYIFMKNQPDFYEISSPNKAIVLSVKMTDKVYYSVDFKGENILWYSPLAMDLGANGVLGHFPKVKQYQITEIEDTIETIWGIRQEIKAEYQELDLTMEGHYSLLFRVYDDGVAYRFQTTFPNKIRIKQEEVAYRFRADAELLAHVVGDFQTSYEKLYTSYTISEIVEAEFISLPLLVKQENAKILIAESDVFDYPGMYIKRIGNNNRFDMQGLFPAYPTKTELGGLCQFNNRVIERMGLVQRLEFDRRRF